MADGQDAWLLTEADHLIVLYAQLTRVMVDLDATKAELARISHVIKQLHISKYPADGGSGDQHA